MVLNVPCSWSIPLLDPGCVRGGGMNFRTTGAIAPLLIGLGASAGDASAQYYPQPQAYPPAYPPAQGYPPHRPLPPIADADDNQIYDLQGRPLPPGAVEPVAPAPPAAYRDPPQGYREQQAPQGHEPAAAGARPYYGSPHPNSAPPSAGAQSEPDGTRPPLPITPGQIGAGQGDPSASGTMPVDSRNVAALPPEVRPETGPKKQLPPQFRHTLGS